MKKIICSFAAIFVFLINIIPFAVAAESYGTILDKFCAEFPHARDDNTFYYISYCETYESFGAQMYYDHVFRISKNCNITVDGDYTVISNTSNSNIIMNTDRRDDNSGWDEGQYITSVKVNSSNTKVIYEVQATGRTYGIDRDVIDYFDTLTPTEDIYDVVVNFNPVLSGNVDREVNNNGVKSMLSTLTMTVENNCTFDIQYDMRIYKKYQQSHRSYDALTADDTFFDDDEIFMYYKNQWVYCSNYDDMNSFLNNETVKENKPSFWHFVQSGQTDTVNIDFSQINLLEGEEYTVIVRAIRNNYGIASEQIVYISSDDPAISEYYQLQGDDIHTVFTSDFVMINYNDVKYDPNNNNNGVLAYNGRNGQAARNNYQYSRNARENANGEIDYSSRNLYTNQNSWLNQQRNNVIANHSSYTNGSIPASLSNHFNSFLSFITSIFGRLPVDIQHIYIYGFVSIVVLGIILKVIK